MSLTVAGSLGHSVTGRQARMVNPLMSGPGISDVLGSSSGLVKLELDHSEDGEEEENKIEVKMEVLEEFFGLGFGGNIIDPDSHKEAELVGGESLLSPLAPPPTYPSPADLPHANMVKTVKVPLSSEAPQHSSFPPVLSIPAAVSASFSGGLQISISPSMAGPDTTTLTSPPPPLTSHNINNINKKPVFTAKGRTRQVNARKSKEHFVIIDFV